MDIAPVGWTYTGGNLIGRRCNEKGGGIANELFLIDEDMRLLDSFAIPDGHGSVNGYDWNEKNGLLVYTMDSDSLFIVDVGVKEVIAQIDGVDIGCCRFMRPQEIRPFIRPELVLTRNDEQEISNTVSTWFSYALAMGRKDLTVPDYHVFWELLSSSSPLRSGFVTDGPSSYELFLNYKKDDMPMLSFNIDSIDISEDRAVANCTCRMAAIDDVMLGTYPERTTTIVITFVQENERWLIYSEAYE